METRKRCNIEKKKKNTIVDGNSRSFSPIYDLLHVANIFYRLIALLNSVSLWKARWTLNPRIPLLQYGFASI